MAEYRDLRRWRHGELQDFHEDVEEGIFLIIEHWHEQVQINLGPNVGDITTKYKPPRRGRVILIVSYLYEAREDKEYGALRRIYNEKAHGPKAD